MEKGTIILQSNNYQIIKRNNVKIIMPLEDTQILEANQHKKSNKTQRFIYADLKCLIENECLIKIIFKIHLQQK